MCDDLEDVAALDGELAEEIRRLPKRGVPEAAPPEGLEPSAEDVNRIAERILVIDNSVFCRHTYVLAVLCMRIEESLGSISVHRET